MSLLKNSIESIQVGVEDYLTEDPKRYLSSVRNISAGILLLYKEKLYRLSPSYDKEVLIKKDIRLSHDSDGNIIFIGKGKKTVDVQGIKDRFKDLRIENRWKDFDELNQLRNNIEHYFTNQSPATIREIVARSFILIRDFIDKNFEEEPCQYLGEECWQALLETSHFYEAEKNSCEESLKQIDWIYPELVKALDELRCQTCHSNLIKAKESGVYSSDTLLICSSCGADFEFGDVVEQCLSESLAGESYIAAKEGGEGPLGTCPWCFEETFLIDKKTCVSCDYELEYSECMICDISLSLEEQDFDGLCAHCSNLMAKDD